MWLAAPAIAAGPHVTATPHLGLTNGRSITVKVVAFPPSTPVTIAQCTGPITSRDQALMKCDLNTLTVVHTDGAGAAKTAFVVHTGAVAQQGRCAAKSKNCSILAVAQTAITQASTPIHFGR
jgi:hypothetical protein